MALDIKSYHTDYRLIRHELTLSNAVRDNPCLSVVANIHSYKGRGERLYALGIAITTIANTGAEGEVKDRANEICSHFVRSESVKIELDHAINMRGLVFIQQCLASQTPLDATIYALGLRIGSDIKDTILDPDFIRDFSNTWQLRLNMSWR